jgi:septal ring factor EnvC (AmiA/AmiB activator)
VVVEVWELIAKNWFKVLVVVVLMCIFVGVFLYFSRGVNAERKALEQVIKRQEEQLKEKEVRIQGLEKQLEMLQRQQVLTEKRIAELKKNRQEVKPPQAVSEIVNRFRTLGYEVFEK